MICYTIIIFTTPHSVTSGKMDLLGWKHTQAQQKKALRMVKSYLVFTIIIKEIKINEYKID